MRLADETPTPVAVPRRLALRLLIGAGSAFATLSWLVAARVPPVMRFDAAVSSAAHRFTVAHHFFGTATRWLTTTAGTAGLVPAGLLVLAWLCWRRRWLTAGYLLTGAVVTTLLRYTVRDLVARPRPVDRLAPASGWAYPSGHTTSAAIAAGVVIVCGLGVLTGRRSRLALVVVAAGWAGLIGCTRVFLTVHWPTDVIGGWLLVTTVAAGLSLLLPRSGPPVAALQPGPAAR